MADDLEYVEKHWYDGEKGKLIDRIEQALKQDGKDPDNLSIALACDIPVSYAATFYCTGPRGTRCKTDYWSAYTQQERIEVAGRGNSLAGDTTKIDIARPGLSH